MGSKPLKFLNTVFFLKFDYFNISVVHLAAIDITENDIETMLAALIAI